jgi:hypothetical protein
MNERRAKARFEIHRELRYHVRARGKSVQSGSGRTVDMGSRGVAFQTDQALVAGAFVELSISWPALLDEVCPMRLSVSGRIVRTVERMAVCSVDKYEFRTQGTEQAPTLRQRAAALQGWMVGVPPGPTVASA